MATKTGWLDGKEVTEVRFNPKRITYGDLLKNARKKSCADWVFPTSEEQAAIAKKVCPDVVRMLTSHKIREEDSKYYLKSGDLKYLPMTPLQTARANELISRKASVSDLLSPTQMALLSGWKTGQPKPTTQALGVPFLSAWKKLQASEHGK